MYIAIQCMPQDSDKFNEKIRIPTMSHDYYNYYACVIARQHKPCMGCI